MTPTVPTHSSRVGLNAAFLTSLVRISRVAVNLPCAQPSLCSPHRARLLARLWKAGTISGKVCPRSGRGSISADFEITDHPLVINWTDSRMVRHSAEFPVIRLLKGREIYGGVLTVEFSDSSVSLYLQSPNKAKNKDGGWPQMFLPAVFLDKQD